MVELLSYVFEDKGLTLNVSYSLNEDDRCMRVNKIFKDYIIEKYTHNGISETNYIDFVNKQDAKYEIEDHHIINFLEWYHKI